MKSLSVVISILLATIFSTSLFASQACIVHTTNEIAQQFLLEKGYQVVNGESDTAHVFLDLFTNRKNSGWAKSGFIFMSEYITDITTIKATVYSSGIVLFKQKIDDSGRKTYIDDYQYPEYFTIQLQLLKEFEKVLRKQVCD